METPKRGKLLSAYLIIIIAISVSYLYFDISGVSRTFPFYEGLPDWMIYWDVASNFVGLIFCYAIWKMKKWGVIGFTILIVVGVILNLIVKNTGREIITALIGIIIFAAIIWKPFNRMA